MADGLTTSESSGGISSPTIPTPPSSGSTYNSNGLVTGSVLADTIVKVHQSMTYPKARGFYHTTSNSSLADCFDSITPFTANSKNEVHTIKVTFDSTKHTESNGSDLFSKFQGSRPGDVAIITCGNTPYCLLISSFYVQYGSEYVYIINNITPLVNTLSEDPTKDNYIYKILESRGPIVLIDNANRSIEKSTELPTLLKREGQTADDVQYIIDTENAKEGDLIPLSALEIALDQVHANIIDYIAATRLKIGDILVFTDCYNGNLQQYLKTGASHVDVDTASQGGSDGDYIMIALTKINMYQAMITQITHLHFDEEQAILGG